MPSKTLFDADRGDDEIRDNPKKMDLSPKNIPVGLTQDSTAHTEKYHESAAYSGLKQKQ